MLIDGQLQSSNFRIINVNGHGARTIAFWTPKHGLVSKMSSPNTTRHLGPVIWPGESLSVPKGWEIPTMWNKLRIGVPVRDGFTELVKVTIDPTTNTTDVTGFSIDVFKAVVDMLPYALRYEFIPFAKPDGTRAGTYNDLCYQVYLGNFDAVVGDITIRANRSLYVDFTMPYAEAGVVMVVPVIDTNKRSAWAFFEPWGWDLWLATLISLLLIGFVVWVVQLRTNEDFQGITARQEVGNVIWFAFSTVVFSQRFTDSKLMALGTMEAIDDALSKGSANNGIAAFVDETPYMNLFLEKYCNKYTMVAPIFKTDGHGFVFPKRSPLLPDVSQAVLNVTGGEKIMNIENSWFKKNSKCHDLTNPRVSSNRLDFESFRVLFFTTLVASGVVLILYIVRFSYKYSDVWRSETSTPRRIQAMLKIFYEIDPSRSNRMPESSRLLGQNSNLTETNFVYSSDSEEERAPLTDRASLEIATASAESAGAVQEMQTTTTAETPQ
ncbi:hypothetical protein ACLB2K_017894 [Fragaria x ananassa]